MRSLGAPILSFEEFEENRPAGRIVVTSGGFDPIHPGHISSVQESSRFGDVVVVVVNGDAFLAAKKGKPFQDLETRCAIVSAISGVDYVVPFEIEGDPTVREALRRLVPDVFTKGGDPGRPHVDSRVGGLRGAGHRGRLGRGSRQGVVVQLVPRGLDALRPRDARHLTGLGIRCRLRVDDRVGQRTCWDVHRPARRRGASAVGGCSVMSRAVVLSGGGPVGIAWQTGLAAGLASEGVALGDADFIVGTSAGSAVGAQLALGRDLRSVVDRYREAAERTSPEAASADAAPATGSGEDRSPAIGELMRVMASAGGEGASSEERLAAIGRFALEADTMPEERFIAGFSYLRGESWPDGYACTSVDAESGDFVVWDAERPAPLERAVSASCAVPGIYPPITIDGRRYIDGGMRSGSNADLARGHDRVVLVSLMAPSRAAAQSDDPRVAAYRERAEREHRILEDSGSSLVVVGPDDDAGAVIGTNVMDGRRSPAAAEAGFQQGQRFAATLAEFWH